jgi:hypothetical protein
MAVFPRFSERLDGKSELSVWRVLLSDAELGVNH